MSEEVRAGRSYSLRPGAGTAAAVTSVQGPHLPCSALPLDAARGARERRVTNGIRSGGAMFMRERETAADGQWLAAAPHKGTVGSAPRHWVWLGIGQSPAMASALADAVPPAAKMRNRLRNMLGPKAPDPLGKCGSLISAIRGGRRGPSAGKDAATFRLRTVEKGDLC